MAAQIITAVIKLGGEVLSFLSVKEQRKIAYQQWLNENSPQYKNLFSDLAEEDNSFNVILILAVLAGLILLAVTVLKIGKNAP